MTTPTVPGWLPPWEGADYAANTSHHRAFDEWFFRDLPLRPSDRVLDLGCGSGDFTRSVAERLTDGEVVGVDAQPSMIEEAVARSAANQSFLVGRVQDLAELLGPDQRPFDLVFSRAVLHWVPAAEHPGVLAQVHRLLRPGGWARIECGGGDNVQRLTDWLDPISARHGGPGQPWTFFGAGRYLGLLEDAGFEVGAEAGSFVRTTAQHRPFDRASVTGWLTSQCLAAYEAGMPRQHHAAFRAEVFARLDELALPDGSFDQTFVRLDCLVRRPASA